MDEYLKIPITEIVWGNNTRSFADQDVLDMVTSLRIHGQIHPIVCKPKNEEDLYQGVCGHLRYMGMKSAGFSNIMARVRSFQDEDEVLEWQLAENLHRKELTALEKADGYARLVEMRKKRYPEESAIQGVVMALEEATGEEIPEQTLRESLRIGRKIGKEARKTSNGLEKKKALNVKTRHLQALSRIEDEHQQAELLRKTANQAWTVPKLKKEVDKVVHGLSDEPQPEPIDTGLVITCSECQEKYSFIHVDEGKHKLQKFTEYKKEIKQ